MKKKSLILFWVGVLNVPVALQLLAQPSSFTYHGQLAADGVPASGAYDLRFTLYDASEGEGVVAGPATIADVVVENGLFMVTLDFGVGVFSGSERWLEIGVAPTGGIDPFTTLNPRQEILSTPYAIKASNSASAESLSGTVAASQLTGTISTDNIGVGTISSSMLADGAVQTTQLANGAVTSEKIGSASDWFQTAAIHNRRFGDYFARAAAIVGTNMVILGAGSSGSATEAYLFGADGKLINTFTDPEPGVFTQDWFGYSVAGVGGNKVIIGDFRDDTGASDAGAAYLFDIDGTLLHTFYNPTPDQNENFGYAVSGVGTDKVLIGAWQERSVASGGGAAYLFGTDGTLLQTFAKLTPEPGDNFGKVVAGVGTDKVVIGAPRDNVGAQHSGAAYLFDTDGGLLTTITNPVPTANGSFGTSVAAVGTDKVVIGSWREKAYVFGTDGTLLTTIHSPEPEIINAFGSSLAAVGTNKVLIGASAYDAGEVENAGAAYLFRIDGTLLKTFINPAPAENLRFGTVVAGVDSERLLVAADEVAYLYGTSDYTPGLVATGVVPNLTIYGKFTGTFDGDGSGLTGISSLDGPDGFPSPALSIDSGGNIGIGTTDPRSPIFLTALRVAKFGHVVVNNNYGFLSANNTSDGIGAGIDTTFSDELELYSGGAARIHVNSAGDVGVGTMAPVSKLDVSGDIAVNGNPIVSSTGEWVGNPTGLVGPQGPEGPGSTLSSLEIKSGMVSGNIDNNVYASVEVTFGTPYLNSNYSVVLTGHTYTGGPTVKIEGTVTSKSSTGFTAYIWGAFASSTEVSCDWVTIPFNND